MAQSWPWGSQIAVKKNLELYVTARFFWGKSNLCAKIVKYGFKTVFRLFRKRKSLLLFWNGVKLKELWSFSILQKLFARENLILKLLPKILLANEMSLFFNHEYLMNGLTWDFDFLKLDGYEWKEQMCHSELENGFPS